MLPGWAVPSLSGNRYPLETERHSCLHCICFLSILPSWTTVPSFKSPSCSVDAETETETRSTRIASRFRVFLHLLRQFRHLASKNPREIFNVRRKLNSWLRLVNYLLLLVPSTSGKWNSVAWACEDSCFRSSASQHRYTKCQNWANLSTLYRSWAPPSVKIVSQPVSSVSLSHQISTSHLSAS